MAPSPSTRKLLIVCPKDIAFEQYVRDLHLALVHSGPSWQVLDPLFFDPLTTRGSADAVAARIARTDAHLVHFQHEYGLMGSKVPGRYRFPRLVKKTRKLAPRSRLVATAHTVLSSSYSYPWKGRGIQAPLRITANLALLPWLRRLWIQRSWGILDGVVAHSSLQTPTLRQSGCPIAVEIPHYVPQTEPLKDAKLPKNLRAVSPQTPVLLVFGYFTPEKGQDIVIRAMAELKTPARLILAGGVRRDADMRYFDHCQSLIAKLGLQDRTQITGFVSLEELDALVRLATLVLLPFRETSGSGSMAALMARRAPILASDLPLNREISERIPNALTFFESENPIDCANQIERLLSDPRRLTELKQGAEAYALAHSPSRIAMRHLEFYDQVLGSTRDARIPSFTAESPL